MSVSASESPAVRVVITGMGLISPLGNHQNALWERLAAGQSAVAPITSLPPQALPVGFAAEARDFTSHVDDFGPLEGEQKKSIRKGLKVMCRECQMGVAAAQLALADAGRGLGKCDPDRSGVVYGSDYMITQPDEFSAGIADCQDEQGRFQFSRWGTQGLAKMNPLWLLKYLPNMPASHIAIYNDLRGPNNSLTQREASGNLAIGEAFRVIQRGHADLMVAGATGTRLNPMKAVHAVIGEEMAPADDAGKSPRPFDRDRRGMVLGEGAGAIVLERRDLAERRGATIYGEVLGAASSSAADRDSRPRVEQALTNSMRAALREAGMSPGDVGHIHAHGLGTRKCDAAEARAIRNVFADQADKVPVTAAKSYFGNLGAGSALVELIASLLALGHGQLFPVLNYTTPDPECPVRIAHGSAVPAGNSFLNLSVTPQAQASCVLVRRL